MFRSKSPFSQDESSLTFCSCSFVSPHYAPSLVGGGGGQWTDRKRRTRGEQGYMGFTRLGGPWTCWVGLGDPPPVGGVGWGPLGFPFCPTVWGSEGGNEGPRGATSQLRLGHRGESGADRALACKLLRTCKTWLSVVGRLQFEPESWQHIPLAC